MTARSAGNTAHAPATGTRQATARRRQQAEELCAAAVRALGADPEVHFRGGRPYRGRRPLPVHAPHARVSPEDGDFASRRGAADAVALRLRGSDARLHAEVCPTDDPAARLVFELLEQFRTEAGAPAPLTGVRANLRHRFTRWSEECARSGLTETARGLLLFTVAHVARSRITGEPVPAHAEDLIEATRAALAPLTGHDLAALRRHRADQRAFAPYALSLARTVAALLASADPGPGTEAGDPPDEDDVSSFAALLALDSDEPAEETPTAVSGRSRVLDGDPGGYRVFTTAYDREGPAAASVRPELLREYRARLDRRIADQGVNVPRLARELQLLLATPARDGWDGGQEAGHIDGRRLPQLITSPAERRLFRTERTTPVADALVTFLLDCSGSMKEHAESVAMLVDVLARALDQAGAACEVLGFTTGAWNGGRARRDWLRAGRPPHPGRLNERRHLVFKDAATPWRRARRGIAALLKPDLYREGIDGEAVEWARARAASRPASRKILFVVSDGSPMDTATHLANDRHYLDHHLREAVTSRHDDTEIHGLGVSLDLSPYYRRSRILNLTQDTGNGMFREVLGLISG
ncbi:cobalt chelatase [Streptomyces sp. Ru73]|uniref:cobaltochelatase CobT-related protein n=1 Tax=Streptomyces sp. Ru73 TaxID=2080748 RepID=UPI000CDE37C6|nr:cobalt chelatase [Streptomyces sp. Ru73]POX43104.1 cobalt chelatase [Streptomyces sp. Ru73]